MYIILLIIYTMPEMYKLRLVLGLERLVKMGNCGKCGRMPEVASVPSSLNPAVPLVCPQIYPTILSEK